MTIRDLYLANYNMHPHTLLEIIHVETFETIYTTYAIMGEELRETEIELFDENQIYIK